MKLLINIRSFLFFFFFFSFSFDVYLVIVSRPWIKLFSFFFFVFFKKRAMHELWRCLFCALTVCVFYYRITRLDLYYYHRYKLTLHVPIHNIYIFSLSLSLSLSLSRLHENTQEYKGKQKLDFYRINEML